MSSKWTSVAIGFVTVSLTCNSFAAAAEPEFAPAALEFFEKEVRPLLVRRCYECHSEKTKEVKGGLRVDSRRLMLRGGDTGPAIVPGKPGDSLLVDAINYGELYQMPPKSKMSAEEIATLTKWVAMGSPWPPEQASEIGHSDEFDVGKRKASHWCWQPVSNPALPDVQARGWPRKDLDRFILAKLEEAGLSPPRPAEKRTLIRRAYFDVIGLPPSIEEVNAFLADESPQAFERVVDHLLDSPHFGERWARHWMDLARYAETYGHEFDYPLPHAFKYRDYLIRAFNADVPYDQFVIEHVAGDLLQQPRRNPERGFNESAIATGFWWLGEATHSPVDVRDNEAGRIDNQLDVFGKMFLGLTIGCARCHDHKFDAISAKDYYALAGFMQSSRRAELFLDPHGKVREAAEKRSALKQRGEQLRADAVAKSPLSGEEFARYLLAAREAAFGERKPDDPVETTDDVVFEDFEKEKYEGWTMEGTAFGDGPQTRETTPDYQGDIGASGTRWVNSHNKRSAVDGADGDQHTGKMTSRPFAIERRFIDFLIDGGNRPGKTCVNLLIDGKAVRTQTGHNANRMRPARFDVAEFDGQEARIEIVDQAKGAWGNIGVDHIVFTNGQPATRRPIQTVAAEFELDATRLAAWLQALHAAEVKEPSHPLQLWHALSESPQPERFAEVQKQVASDQQQAAALDEKYPRFTEFSDMSGWFVSGEAFSGEPAASGEWNAREGGKTWLRPGSVDSGRLGTPFQGALRSPTFTLNHRNIYYRAKGRGVKIRLVLDGYFMDTYNALLFRGFSFDLKADGKFAWHQQASDIGRYLGHRAYIEILDHGDGFAAIDEIRFSNEGPPPELHGDLAPRLVGPEVRQLSELAGRYGQLWEDAKQALAIGSLTPSSTELLNWAGRHELIPYSEATAQQCSDLSAAWQAIQVPNADRTLGMTDGTGENEHVFVRGNHKTRGAEVARRSLEAFGASEIGVASGSGRLELARQIADSRNPLTARVIVNRLWHHLFGRGIVASTDNFGVLGQEPTHPRLLDHLATQFVAEGWSVKRLLKTMMLSSTYQMASTPSPRAAEVDPANLLLHRARIRRLQGEAIRDAMLTISGRLDRTLYGGSVPIHITSFMQGRGRPKGSGPLDGHGRRSVYLEVRRNFLSPMMLAFDTPIPFNSVGRRNVSNVPAQALTVMNDPFVLEQAKLWAQRSIAATPDPNQRLQKMYQAAFARLPTASELASATAFIEQQAAELGLDSQEHGNDERLWTDLCHVLMNVKEFVFIH